MSAAAGIALLTLIAQVESAGQTRVLLLNDCPAGLEGFYAPSRNRIGLCRNNHSGDAGAGDAAPPAHELCAASEKALLGLRPAVIGRPITS